MTRTDYLKTLSSLAAALAAPRGPNETDLQLFRDRIMARPDDLRRRLLGANVQRRRLLEGEQRQALDVLETIPDLLSPLGELRYEPSHSRLVAHFMNVAAEPRLARRALHAFLNLINVTEDLTGENLSGVVVEPERWLAEGRVDISITLPGHLVFIEMKVDASEGADQLQRYFNELELLKGSRQCVLVYLTLPDAAKSTTEVPHVHINMRQLLSSWLSIAGSGNDSRQYLARYLKSVGLLVGCAGNGRFDDWSITQQWSALNLVEALS